MDPHDQRPTADWEMVLTREADHEQRDGEAQDVHGQVEPFV